MVAGPEPGDRSARRLRMAVVGPDAALAGHRSALAGLCRTVGVFAGLDRETLDRLAPLEAEVVFFLPAAADRAELWQELAQSCGALVVIAAGPEHLVEAFHAGAIDYLIHPFDGGALFRTLRRAAKTIAEAPPERFAVRRGRHLHLVAAQEVLWIRGAGNYVELATPRERYRLRARLRDVEARLDGRRFVRVHRSHIVRIDAVDSLTHVGRGEYQLTLRDGTTVKLTRTYRASLAALRAPMRLQEAADRPAH